MKNNALLILVFFMGLTLLYSCKKPEVVNPPNILWIYVEDISPNFKCYGDEMVNSPHIDELSEHGVLFRNTFMPAPVCSPCRSAIITGAMPTTFGVHNHHSSRTKESAIQLPDYVKTIPELFKEKGYFTFNHGKDDYNFSYDREDLYSGEIRDNGMYGLVGKAIDWNARSEGQPFFGQIQLAGNKYIYGRSFKDKVIRPIKPYSIKLPPYYPDNEFMRQEWATYLETMELTDQDVGNIIDRLRKDGVLENTYIFFFSDHGMRLWRHKQFLYDSGTQVPFILAYFGDDGKIQKGKVNDDLISGLDIGTTSLGLAEILIPEYTEGHDFLSKDYTPRNFVISVRDRCDFTIDRIRSVRTKEFKYIRNYFPERPYMQPNYRDAWDITKEMRALVKEGGLNEIQNRFWAAERPAEELYDIVNDPFEINNLADDPVYSDRLAELRGILQNWINQTGDKGQYVEDIEGLKFMYGIWGDKCVNPEYDKVKALPNVKKGNKQ